MRRQVRQGKIEGKRLRESEGEKMRWKVMEGRWGWLRRKERYNK